ncbi:MAG: hypothetical protein A3C44_04715 [Gammaproteobacteria bacterium RIFCSPHIGHO2_02_FULL_39_13]|nr:MAG: hypothetical protein A3C44_04715 [Gammaproteobacteria bacterium RIFCSPHIGHO2_02_FULL_39_13]OGT50433.1 MAG: hypothetical protein A3E53_04530 [Gammaproteobacteria bacterium RIFCSPHIGHO2_12_FULL_39_24]
MKEKNEEDISSGMYPELIKELNKGIKELNKGIQTLSNQPSLFAAHSTDTAVTTTQSIPRSPH